MEIEQFYENYLDDGAPITKETIAWAIKKYVYFNYNPSMQDKLEMYEAFIADLVRYGLLNEHEKVNKLLANLKTFQTLQLTKQAHIDPMETKALINEAFYNLRTL